LAQRFFWAMCEETSWGGFHLYQRLLALMAISPGDPGRTVARFWWWSGSAALGNPCLEPLAEQAALRERRRVPMALSCAAPKSDSWILPDPKKQTAV
jgi:hypothetical protein